MSAGSETFPLQSSSASDRCSRCPATPYLANCTHVSTGLFPGFSTYTLCTFTECSHITVDYSFYRASSYASTVLAVVILSVWPFVCHTRALWQNQTMYGQYVDTTQYSSHSSFLTPAVKVEPATSWSLVWRSTGSATATASSITVLLHKNAMSFQSVYGCWWYSFYMVL